MRNSEFGGQVAAARVHLLGGAPAGAKNTESAKKLPRRGGGWFGVSRVEVFICIVSR
jgi:hypothetical protein